jgi:hypothetical protein
MTDQRHEDAKADLRGVSEDTIYKFSDATTPWTRTHDGEETNGARFDRTVLKRCLPASLRAIDTVGELQGFDPGYGNNGTRGHLAWAISRGYVVKL